MVCPSQSNSSAEPGPEEGSSAPKSPFIERATKRLVDLSKSSDWELAKHEWEIEKVIYSKGGIAQSEIERDGKRISTDEFGNNPSWIFAVRNSSSQREIYIGPDDVRVLFGEIYSDRLFSLIAEKKDSIRADLRSLKSCLQLAPAAGLSGDLQSRAEEILGSRRVSDRDQPFIEGLRQVLEARVRERFGIDLERALTISHELESVYRSHRSGRLQFIDPDQIKLIEKWVNKSEDKDLGSLFEELISLHDDLAEIKGTLREQSRKWGNRATSQVQEALEPLTPAFHSNIWVAQWLLNDASRHSQVPAIVDIGANLSVLYRTFMSLGDSGEEFCANIFDLEKAQEIAALAVNPNRVCGDIADPNLIEQLKVDGVMPNSFGVALCSFMLDQLTGAETRLALQNIEQLLSPGDSDRPGLLIITTPYMSRARTERFHEAMVGAAGYRERYSEALIVNALKPESRVRLQENISIDIFKRMEKFFCKPFNVLIYEKARPLDVEALQAFPEHLLDVRVGEKRTRSHGTKPFSHGSLLEGLLRIDVAQQVTPNDFITSTGKKVTRLSLITGEATQFSSFEKDLCILVWMRGHLSRRDRLRVNIIREKWVDENVDFLSHSDVEFVCSRASSKARNEGIRLERLSKDPTRALAYAALLKDREIRKEKFEADASRYAANETGGRWTDRTDSIVQSSRRKLERTARQRRYSYQEVFKIEESERARLGRRLPNFLRYFQSDLLKSLGAVAARLGRTPSYNDLLEASRRKECASPYTYERQFGSIRHAQRLAGLVPNVYPPEVLRTEQRMISELQKIASTLGRTPGVSDMREYQAKGLCSPVKAFINHFGTLRAAQEAAGLTPNIPGYEQGKSKEVLIRELQTLSAKLGFTPSMKDISVACKRGEISSPGVYSNAFGSVVNAQREAGLFANVSNKERSKSDEQIFKYLRAFTHSLGRLPTMGDLKEAFEHDGFLSRGVISSRFGSLMDCLSQARINPAYFPAELDRSRENLLSMLKSLAEKLGRSPTMGDVDRHQDKVDPMFPTSGVLVRTFGSYGQALREAGLSENLVIKDRKTLVNELKKLGEELGHTPTSSEIATASKAHKCATQTTYMKHFGSIPEALRAAGFEVKTESDKRQDAITALQVLAAKLGRTPANSDLDKARKSGFPIGEKGISGEFGSLREFQIAAGLVPNKNPKAKVRSNEQLLAELRLIEGELGRTPMQADLAQRSKNGQCASPSVYSARFGNFSKALSAAGIELGRHAESVNKSDEQILKELGSLIVSLGRDPTQRDLIQASKEKKCTSINSLTRRFGSIGEAVRRAKEGTS